MRNWSRYSSVLPSYMAGESRSRVKMRLRIKKNDYTSVWLFEIKQEDSKARIHATMCR